VFLELCRIQKSNESTFRAIVPFKSTPTLHLHTLLKDILFVFLIHTLFLPILLNLTFLFSSETLAPNRFKFFLNRTQHNLHFMQSSFQVSLRVLDCDQFLVEFFLENQELSLAPLLGK
jgi:hypothetical protein